MRFNPNLEQERFGAVMAIINNITMLAIVLTGSALIREREHGTIEHLLVMPVTPFEIMMAKIWSMGLVVLVVSALLTAGYLLPVVTEGFFPGRDFITERREVGVQMTWPMIAFAAAVVLIGLLPGGLLHWLGLLAARLFP